MSSTATPPVLTVARILAGVTAALTIGQAVLGILMMLDAGPGGVHRALGMATAAAAVVTAGATALWFRRSRNSGLLGHAVGLAVLAIAQVGLGEVGLRSVHVGLGVLVLVAAVALVGLLVRKPHG